MALPRAAKKSSGAARIDKKRRRMSGGRHPPPPLGLWIRFVAAEGIAAGSKRGWIYFLDLDDDPIQGKAIKDRS